MAPPPIAVAIATCAEHAGLDDEGRLLLAALAQRGADAEAVVWDAEPDGGWDRFDLVVVRSTWDYTFAAERFLAWTRAVGPRLLNSPATIAWSADKRYLLDLAAAGLPVVATELLAPGTAFAPPPGRFVVKPAVSAGSRGAAVFDAARHDAARAHVAALHADGCDVLVQPYLDAVDGEEAETALVFIDGELSHAMRKGPLLALDRPPVNAGWAPEMMSRREPADDVAAVGRRVHELVAERFGAPLYARVDVLRDAAGVPAVLEVELVEPSLFLEHAPGTAQALAGAILARVPASGR
jgi:glutathione synthase/RimK-type ligase-like ATP-grasp enzyme